jgi:hypothetical protein
MTARDRPSSINPPSDGPFERLQRNIRHLHNRAVRKHFRDVPDDPELWEVHNPRHALMHSALISDDDSGIAMLLRLWHFELLCRHATALHPPLYTMPAQEYHESVRFKPQVICLFQESSEEAEKAKRRPKTVRVSFRLMSQKTSDISQADLDRLTTSLKTHFPMTYKFRTGRIKLSYRDRDRGLELIVSPYSVSGGKDLLTKIVRVHGALEPGSDAPDWTKLSISQKAVSNFDANEYTRVLGKRKVLPKRRPVAFVSLRRVELALHGQLESIVLLERW